MLGVVTSHVGRQLRFEAVPEFPIMQFLDFEQRTAAVAVLKFEIDGAASDLHFPIDHNVVGLAVILHDAAKE